MSFDVDPDVAKWTPSSRRMWKPPPEQLRLEVGDVVGLWYAAWRVIEVRIVEDVDLLDEDRKNMRLYKPEYRERQRPYHVLLEHERGPLLVQAQRIHDGTRRVSITITDGLLLNRLPERYQVCSCHGDPWPCRDQIRDWEAEAAAASLDRLMAQATPGVCAACLEPITSRQASLQFPEEHALIPGAPGPAYHAGRGGCWYAASQYEEKHRLPAHPGAARLASCPGHAYVHVVGGQLDCSAGEACTGLHGPAKERRQRGDCFSQTLTSARDPDGGGWITTGPPPPAFDCGFRHPQYQQLRCLGAPREETR